MILIQSSTLTRWCKFNIVGAIGIVVQLSVLYVMKSLLHLTYLASTALAVEAAILHNFVWHQRFTWPDRVAPAVAQTSWRRSLPRFIRFHLSNGAISIFGNLVLMKAIVGIGHANYLLANALAIAVCSVANFGLSERWVFGESGG